MAQLSLAARPPCLAALCRAARLALYAAAIRCKWPRVANWTCANCKISQTQLLDAFVSDDKYEDAKDAFTVRTCCGTSGMPEGGRKKAAKWQPSGCGGVCSTSLLLGYIQY